MRWFNGFCLLFVTAVLFSCSSPQEQPCLQEDILYQVDGFLAKNPDSAAKILDTLNVNVLSEKGRAYYCLLKVKVQDRFMNYDDETDSLLQEAKRFFVGSEEYYLEAQTCEALSRVGFSRGESFAYHIEWLQKGVESIKRCQHIDERFLLYRNDTLTEQEVLDLMKYKLIWRLGLTYISCDNEKSIQYLRESFQYFEKSHNTLFFFRAAFMLGDAFLQAKEYDSCLYYYDKGRQAAEQLDDPAEYAVYPFGMAAYYKKRAQDTISTEEYLNQAITECHKGLHLLGDSLFKYKDGFYSILSFCHCRLEAWDSCRYYAEKHLDFLEEHHVAIVPNEMHMGIYQRLYKSYAALGNAEKALQNVTCYLDMSEKLKDEPQEVQQIIKEYEEKLEEQRLASEQQVKRYRQYLWIALILLAFLSICWLYLRNRNNREIENLRFQEELHKLQMDLEKTSQNTKQITSQRAFDIYRSNPKDAMEQILNEFNLHYPETIGRLISDYPDLTKTEQQIIILTFLGFRAKEEADLLHLSENTVMKYRSNIKKKVDKNLYTGF